MERRRNPRVCLWIFIAALLCGVFYLYNQQQTVVEEIPPAVSQAAVMSDFMSMEEIEIPVEPALGGNFYTTELLFSSAFKGEAGEIFYARMEDGHIGITVGYRISSISESVPPVAVYEPIGDYYPNYDPGVDFVARSLTQNSVDSAE